MAALGSSSSVASESGSISGVASASSSVVVESRQGVAVVGVVFVVALVAGSA